MKTNTGLTNADASADSNTTLIDTEESLGMDVRSPITFTAWMQVIFGQWSTIQADWTLDRNDLAKA